MSIGALTLRKGGTAIRISLLAILVGLLGCLLFAFLLGESPWLILRILWFHAFRSLSDVGTILYLATPMIFTGLALSVSLRVGLVNLGAEGQLYMGSLALTALAIGFPKLPWGLAIPLGIVAAFVGGAFWGGIAGILKTKRGNHEIIVTILLNFLAYAVCEWALQGPLHAKESPLSESSLIGTSYHLIKWDFLFPSSPLNTSFVIALVLAGICWFFLKSTRLGFEFRLVGEAQGTAVCSLVPVGKRIRQAMYLSGGLAGLVAMNEVMGYTHKFKYGFSPGYGFTGIVVALLGKNHPGGVVIAAILLAIFQKASFGFERDTVHITKEVTFMIQALILLFVISGDAWIRLTARWSERIRTAWRRTPSAGVERDFPKEAKP